MPIKSGMNTIRQLMQKIIGLTTKIETNYPELYKYLDETPLEAGNPGEKEITARDFENYLNILKG